VQADAIAEAALFENQRDGVGENFMLEPAEEWLSERGYDANVIFSDHQEDIGKARRACLELWLLSLHAGHEYGLRPVLQRAADRGADVAALLAAPARDEDGAPVSVDAIHQILRGLTDRELQQWAEDALTYLNESPPIFGKQTLIGRAAQPSELAPAFVFLASNDARYITGSVMDVTGGEMMP
jgi:hypothetical protein